VDGNSAYADGAGASGDDFREKGLAGAAHLCQICHQQNFVGGLPAPRLAGQRYEYLVEAMRRFADGERTNNTDMANLMKAISPADREALARYLSGL
jgi:cytochrome c553